MKRNSLLFGILAIVLVVTIGAVGCDNGSTGGSNTQGNGDPQKVVFTGYDADGNMYILTLTEKTENTPRATVTTTTYLGWGYVLIYKIKGLPDQISEGIVSAYNNVNNTLELQLYVDYAPWFSISISVSDITITMIVGVITFNDGETQENPGALTPQKPIVSDPSGFKYTVESNGTLTIVGYTGDANSLKIPAELDEKPVTGIGEGAFYDKNNITIVTIPNNITSIGKRAFSHCYRLTVITIPDSVTSVRTPLLSSTLWYSLLL